MEEVTSGVTGYLEYVTSGVTGCLEEVTSGVTGYLEEVTSGVTGYLEEVTSGSQLIHHSSTPMLIGASCDAARLSLPRPRVFPFLAQL